MGVTITDRRNLSREEPVWEVILDQMSWTTTHEEQTESVAITGIITQIIWTIGDGGVADPDVVFEIQDASGNVIFTTTENDDQAVIDYAGGDFGYNQLSMRNFIVSANPDGAPTTSLTVDIVIRGI